MASRDPDSVIGPTPLRHSWHHTTFVHWPYDPELLEPVVPRGLELDLFDGTAWVGLTPFLLDARMPGPACGLGRISIPETNLRTYVRAEDGRDGLLFLSLDIGNPALAVLGRAVVPYHWASARFEQDGGRLKYGGCRRPTGRASYSVAVEPGGALEPGPLDTFLTGRWRAYSRRGPLFLATPVAHQPWPLQTANLVELDQTLTTAAGLPQPEVDPVVTYASRVDVILGLPRPASTRH